VPQDGPGPYLLSCSGVASGEQTLIVHVQDVDGVTTDVPITIQVS
jgi:hypothetical protein